MSATQLSRGGAVVMGLLFAACGLPPFLAAMGILPVNPHANAPTWVAFAIGLLFVIAGLSIILAYAVGGGLEPDGELPATTPFAVRAIYLMLSLAIVGLMTAIFGWVAFGSGPRQFTSTVALPFVAHSGAGNETSGRLAFGAATLVLAAMFIAFAVVGITRLWRARFVSSRPAACRTRSAREDRSPLL